MDHPSRTNSFPVTPEILIEATYPNHTTGKKLKRNTIFPGQERTVDEFNIAIANPANFIYASRGEELDWLMDYARESDDLKKRVQMLLRNDTTPE